jgi:hypothetical protein
LIKGTVCIIQVIFLSVIVEVAVASIDRSESFYCIFRMRIRVQFSNLYVSDLVNRCGYSCIQSFSLRIIVYSLGRDRLLCWQWVELTRNRLKT